MGRSAPPSSTPVPPAEPRDPLFERVRDYLLAGGVRPGDRIPPEVELAAHFGVSRYRIRTVLGALAHMGLLERTARRGTVIRAPDQAGLSEQILFQFNVGAFDVAEYMEARAVIECAVLPLAVMRASPVLLRRMEESIAALRATAGNPEAADRHDLAFHLLILEACGNRTLQSFAGLLSALFANFDYRRQFHRRDYMLDVIAAGHERILDAIRRHDTREAVRQMQQHLVMAQQDIPTIL